MHHKKRLRVRNINMAEPLAAVECYLIDSLEKGGNICLLEAQEILKQDETWRKVLSVSPPEYWKELSYLSHIVTFLKIGKKEPNRAILQVDDPIEEKILIKTTRIIREIGEKDKYKIWGIYPLQKIFLNPEYYPDSDLYYCPDIKLNISILRKIVTQSRYGGSQKAHPLLYRTGACNNTFVAGRINKKDTGCLGSSCKQELRKCPRLSGVPA
ncbi:MAG: hypothetical protein D3906_05240 [Candidatus Electrothrix sp. AUS1_2]|nr:hypothetical protein [Candidatus Electrothrix sp. AUS1_2]